jgi:hypothetical protein
MYLHRYNMAMQPNLDDLLKKRDAILRQMQAIDRLRRGTLSQQFFKAKADAVPRGPYYVLQGFLRGKKFSQRVPPDQADQVQQDVDNYRNFQALAEEFVTLSDQLTCLQDHPQDSKKNSSRRSSPTSSSKKPPLS